METANNGKFSSYMDRRSDAKFGDRLILTLGDATALNKNLERAGELVRTEH